MQILHVKVTSDSEGQRIDNFLLRELRNVPRSRVYRILRKGEVRINGRRSKPTQRLQVGDVVRIPVENGGGKAADQIKPPARVLRQLEQCILYEDGDILAINKPCGLAVHGGSGLGFGLIECVRHMFPGLKRLELAHRLDRDTSGCILIAKNRKSVVRLHDLFRKRQIRKTYELLVYGCWNKSDRSVRLSLLKFTSPAGERRVRVDPEGKQARTEFSVIEQKSDFTWLRARPYTGRTHQIRVHALACGKAIVGDDKYASDAQLEYSANRGIRRLCLHASSLVLPAIETAGSEEQGGVLKIEAVPPPSFVQAWKQLE